MLFFEPGNVKTSKNAPARNAPQQTPSDFGSTSQNIESATFQIQIQIAHFGKVSEPEFECYFNQF